MGRQPRNRESAHLPTLVSRPSLPPIEEYTRHLRRIWKSRLLTNAGPYSAELERRLSSFLPSANVVSVANGTLALQLSLRALGGPRGPVITTPFTFAATTTSLIWEGYTPRFVDIDSETFNLDPLLVSESMSADTFGVLSVHVFGNPAGSQEMAAIARENDKWMIFDAAHAFGVAIAGKSLFDLGSASTLSFHATKSFHTFEGGAVTSSRRGVAERVRRLRNFGLESSNDIRVPGINAKMSEAHAAMGVTNLSHVDDWIRARRRRYELYRDLLQPSGRVTFQKVVASRYNFVYMPILLATRRMRGRVLHELRRHAVYPRLYFSPLTSQFQFLRQWRTARCPVAQDVADRILTLPLYPDLPLSRVRRIAHLILKSSASNPS